MGGHGGIGGCTVNDETELKLGTMQTNPKCRISLQQRPFLTVPYLGRGAVDSITESKLQQGDAVSNRDIVAKTMSSDDILSTQALAHRCITTKYKRC